MNNEQLKTIVSLFTGTQMAIVHLCNMLAIKNLASKEEIAESFDATAALLPDSAAGTVLRQIASGIRNSASPEAMDQTAALLARLNRQPPPAAD